MAVLLVFPVIFSSYRDREINKLHTFSREVSMDLLTSLIKFSVPLSLNLIEISNTEYYN